MTSIAMPPAGSRVRVVIRHLGEVFGDVIPATLKSGRLPIAPWGLPRTFCFEPEDITAIEVIDPSSALVQRKSYEQRHELAERYARARKKPVQR